jgi:serine/threonine protein kinase/formylglycine-generating enzyme required for sulfatase activity
MDEAKNLPETRDFQASADGSPPSFLLGDPLKIGRYRIVGRLGQGGFGRVYLAHDDELDRPVAIKVPNPERVASAADVAAYLAEARVLARLDDPHIVPVYDVGQTEDGLCYAVSKCIEGTDLADRLRQGRPSFRESAELVATVALALHHAHIRGLVHRDIKPANILLDTKGQPWVADFGLALRDEDNGEEAPVAGTPAYMSPEQARGEGHRVDGRSDIFSLGIVLYELLSGRRPFRGDSHAQVLQQVVAAEPRPPRQVDDTIPKELERIVLKALSKRATERYTTARDLAEDLRRFLQTETVPGSSATAAGPVTPPPGSTQEATPAPPTPARSDSEQQPVKIIPKGLRSFDRHDAHFFLELLPGPRDRDGLPESLRFWKTRIEAIELDATFKLGLIYGPSGCGKSSLVKAGLLPRLAKHVLAVYVEATAEETETRLLKAMRKACPELGAGLGLVGSVAALRRERVLHPGEKVLVILDQFEQWLFARRGEQDTELVAALRQCDGERVQAIVLVRDDFWLAASRFMRDLEIDLEPHANIALVDLFDLQHARKVLTAFGRAYGKLPDRDRDQTREQDSFLNQAVTGLAQDGRIISVRLALFAEMAKGKPWTPATLREVGGAEGVGLTFLEETFSSPQANPRHRLHQKAAQSVLKALLPQTGTDIKGQMRSVAELRAASGYADQPRDFDDLVRILDPELRLITPTDPEGAARDEGRGTTEAAATSLSRPVDVSPVPPRCYQLTHDYLVQSLRDWLTRKQRETRRGRAELRLADRAALWSARPENRRLPSVLEWANIRLLTRKREWTETQRRMMRRAAHLLGLRGLGLAILIALVTWVGIEGFGHLRAAALVEFLRISPTSDVPAVVEKLSSHRRWATPRLERLLAENPPDSREHLHASLALLEVDPSQVDFLFGRLLNAAPTDLSILREALEPHRARLTLKLWTMLDAAKPGDDRLLTSAGALALYDPESPRWADLGDKVAQSLVMASSVDVRPWLEALRPVRARLTAPLAAIFRDKERPEDIHAKVTDILADYAQDAPGLLAELLMNADPKAYRALFPIAGRRSAEVLSLFGAELDKKADPIWDDPPLDPSRPKPDPVLMSRIESAQGLFAERFAFCQTMPLAEFLTVAEGLRESGFRPVRFRPYADGPMVRVAAVWTRDGRAWRMDSGLTADEVHRQDEANRQGGAGRQPATRYIPVDVAGYISSGRDGKATDRYAALWVEPTGLDEDARIYAGATAADHQSVQDRLKQARRIPRTLQALLGFDGRTKYSGVWGRPSAATPYWQVRSDQSEGSFDRNQTLESDKNVVDVTVSPAEPPRSFRERYQAKLVTAQKTIEAKPGSPGHLLRARMERAYAFLRLGEDRKALDDLNAVLGKAPDEWYPRVLRAIVHARLGQKNEARDDLAQVQKGRSAAQTARLYLAVVVAANLGEGQDEAFARLESALNQQPDDPQLHRDAAGAYALAAQALARTDRPRSARHAERAIGLLQAAISKGFTDYDYIQEAYDLDPIRERPAFAEIIRGSHPDRRYAVVWSADVRFEATPVRGLDPAEHLRRGRALMDQGYRPVALSVARTMPDGPPVMASVWHRPLVPEEVKDRLAERQARAAIALVRLGHADQVWPRLQHSPDPRLRSFMVNWISPSGTDPKLLTAELVRLDTPAIRHHRMDAILFHPETSIRRALILALGTYRADTLSPGEREPQTAKLLDLYRNDPDAGIHGSAGWALRQWKQDEELKAADAELSRLKDRGARRWFVNSQGQTFTIIAGPVELRMGSPASEPESFRSDEQPQRRVIARPFAVAATEVTDEQYREFEKENPRLGHYITDRYTPDLKGPLDRVSWYHAAAYCNWLSRKENLPECYEPNASGEYAQGMRIKADAFERTGYRLPTEAEWEYAARAGGITSRPYGLSVELLGKYAWYGANSHERAWPAESLLPNDLGVFDMLGNVQEWCQEPFSQPGRTESSIDDITIDNIESFPLRGGAYPNPSADVRSAYRISASPSLGNIFGSGFRLARTYK